MSRDVEVRFVKIADPVNSVRYGQVAPETATITDLYLARAILEELGIEAPKSLRVTVHFDD